MGPSPIGTLPEFIRITEPNGLMAFTIRSDYFDANHEQFSSLLAAICSPASTLLAACGTKYCELLAMSEPYQYVPNIVTRAKYRIWLYRVLAQ
jgi:hypothetical protein